MLRALLQDLPDGWTTANEGAGTWSPFDVVGHLIHGERTDWIPRARIILAQGAERRFTPYDRFAQLRESQGQSLGGGGGRVGGLAGVARRRGGAGGEGDGQGGDADDGEQLLTRGEWSGHLECNGPSPPVFHCYVFGQPTIVIVTSTLPLVALE